MTDLFHRFLEPRATKFIVPRFGVVNNGDSATRDAQDVARTGGHVHANGSGITRDNRKALISRFDKLDA